MEDWTALALLVALGFNLVAGAWNSAAAIRYRRKEARLDREAWGARPLLPPDKVEVMRPGDTVLMLLPLDGMTADQQTAMAGSIKAMAESAKARSIEFMVVPDRGQKAIVVSRGIQAQHADDEAARKETSEWLFGVWKEARRRDQAALAELEARTKATFKEGLELVDLSSNHAHIAIVRSYDAATHTCMVEVPWRTGLIKADIDYPQKYAPMILKAGMKVYVRFFPAIEGYVAPD